LVRQANKSLVAEESEKLYHVLFDCVSHELKTPLAILSTAIGHLRENLKRGDNSQALAVQSESMIAICRLRRFVDNLLGMTRMESGHGDKEAVWCDLEEIVGSAREQISDLLKQHRLNISIPDSLPVIQADPILLTHVITNLLTNAAQYSPAGSLIDIVAAKDGGQIVLRVIDQGEGIPTEELTGRLFEKFHRGCNAKPGGTGLGLSIVSRFMELIGGTVTAENNPGGKGAMFTLKFPIKNLPAEGDV
jgi:two-component system sensor histidine kinase KdpD